MQLIVGMYTFLLKMSLINFLLLINCYPHSEFRFICQSIKCINNYFPFKIVSTVTYAFRLFINLHAVAARHHATLLIIVESIWGLTKKGIALTVVLHQLATILMTRDILN